MAVTVSADDVLVGYANVLYAPLGSAIPDETTVAWGATWPTGWSTLGYTSTPASFSYTYTTFDVNVQQSTTPIRRSVTADQLSITFTLAQFVGEVLALVMRGTNTTTAAGAGQKGFDRIVGGGDTQMKEYMVGLEGYRPDAAGNKQPVRIILYKATINQNGDIAFDKGAATEIPVQAVGLADSTKTAGQQVFEIQIVKAAATS